jgi:hypothetical protein
MKKLIGLIKTKEKEDKAPVTDKKANAKEDKALLSPSREQESSQPQDLFWDDYSDVGYC